MSASDIRVVGVVCVWETGVASLGVLETFKQKMEHFLEIFSKHLDRFDVEAERSTQS